MNDMTARTILRFITWVLFKHKISILAVLAFTLSCFAFGTFLITPQWKATAKLLVLQDPKQQMILFGDLEAPIPVDSSKSAMDLVEILTGNELAKKVVTEFQLDERKRRSIQEPQTLQERMKSWLVELVNLPITIQVQLGLRPPPQPNWLEKAMDDLIEEMEDIELVEETSTILVSIWADDREMAVDICNYMVEFLLERTRNFDRSEANHTYDFVTDQLINVEAALKAAEDKLSQFMTAEEVIDLEAERSMLLARRDQLTTETAAKETQLAALHAQLEELKSQLETVHPLHLTSARTGPETQSEVDVLPHPLVSMRNSIDEVTVEKGILAAQLEISKTRGESEALTAQLRQVHDELSTYNTKDLALKRLLRSTTGLHERFLNLHKKQLELEVQKYTETSEFDIKVADQAYIPPRAEIDWPSWGLNLVVGFLLGTIFGIGQAFFFEFWSDTLQQAGDVAESGIDVLGSIRPVTLGSLARQLAVRPPTSTPAG